MYPVITINGYYLVLAVLCQLQYNIFIRPLKPLYGWILLIDLI